MIDASIGVFFVSLHCWCFTLVWTPFPLLSPWLSACLPFFCCLCHSLPFPSIFSLSLALSLYGFFLLSFWLVYFKMDFLGLSVCPISSAGVCRCLFRFCLSLPNSLFGLISRSAPSHCATSLPLFLHFLKCYFSIHRLPISNIAHSILIKGYLLYYVFFYIVYSWFSSHPPILLLLSGVKNGRVHFLHRTFSLKSDVSCAAHKHSQIQMMMEVKFIKNKLWREFFIVLMFINTVSMVTPLRNCLLLCDRRIYMFFREGTCLANQRAEWGGTMFQTNMIFIPATFLFFPSYHPQSFCSSIQLVPIPHPCHSFHHHCFLLYILV